MGASCLCFMPKSVALPLNYSLAYSVLAADVLYLLLTCFTSSQVHLVFSSSQNVSLFRITILRHTEPILLLHEHSNA